jgi:DtxR family transcriptional regulator, Mn-dependent transcriptional regulator
MAVKLSDSLEDYLEAIYNIILEKNGVRVKDIAKRLGVKNSSVTVALRSLSGSGMINYEPYGVISLTQKGNLVARRITEKHRILKFFFHKMLGIDKPTAETCACEIEHSMPPEVFKRFMQFIKFSYLSHRKTPGWLNGFREFYTEDTVDMECDNCFEEYMSEVEGFIN